MLHLGIKSSLQAAVTSLFQAGTSSTLDGLYLYLFLLSNKCLYPCIKKPHQSKAAVCFLWSRAATIQTAPAPKANSDRLGGRGFKIGTLPLDYFWQGGRRIGAIFKLPTPIQFEKPSVFAAFLCVWMKKKKSRPVIPRSWFRVLNWTLATFRLNVAPWTKSSMQPAEETWVIFQITPLSKLSHF